MSDDDAYLWDGTGEPDEEVVRLERTLGGLRYDRAAPSLRPVRRIWPWAALAAAMLIGVAYVATRPETRPTAPQIAEIPLPEAAWTCEMTDLSTDGSTTRRVAVGEWLETGESDRARLDVANIGVLDVLPRSRLQLIRTGVEEHRVRLDRGAIHAVVTAPPRLFVVETPAADAVDMGCEYTLEVDEDGDGTLEVATGWVALEGPGRPALVPAGAMCAIRAETGPGTPHVADAPVAVVAVLDRLDSGSATDGDLATLLSAVRKPDALSLWHVLAVVEGEDRERVHDRLAELVPHPYGVTRENALGLHADTLEVWFDEIVFGSTD